MSDDQRPTARPPSPPTFGKTIAHPRRGQRIAVMRGQDKSRFTDVYHVILTAPWWLFFLGLAAFFAAINIVFAGLYLADPVGLAHARHGSFWDAFLFSVETLGSINYTVFIPQTLYANIIVTIEAFFGLLTIALFTGIIFARFSRPYARILFSKVAVIVPFDGVPTLMFRTANQRGNSILEAAITVSLARQQITREGIVMRRFETLKLARANTSLFALSWTVMHHIDESSPLYGANLEAMIAGQMELIVMLSGTDETLADRIYARHIYGPGDIVWNRHFVDVLSVTPKGRRMVDLTRFHDTEALNI